MATSELEAEAVRLQRIGDIAAAEAKKKAAQAAARKRRDEEKHRVATATTSKRSVRKRTRTERAQVWYCHYFNVIHLDR